jgi:hypothetical protein
VSDRDRPGVNDTEQLAAPRLPARLHRPPPPRFPAPALENLIVPFGVAGAPGPSSVTVALHVVACPGVIAVGEQPTKVEVGALVTPKPVDALLTECVASPE